MFCGLKKKIRLICTQWRDTRSFILARQDSRFVSRPQLPLVFPVLVLQSKIASRHLLFFFFFFLGLPFHIHAIPTPRTLRLDFWLEKVTMSLKSLLFSCRQENDEGSAVDSPSSQRLISLVGWRHPLTKAEGFWRAETWSRKALCAQWSEPSRSRHPPVIWRLVFLQVRTTLELPEY